MTPYYEHELWPAFLASIRSAPDDDLPRLVAADWLDERGEGERAELIRVALESYRLDSALVCHEPHRLLDLLRHRDKLARQNCRRWWGDATELFCLKSPPDEPNTFDGGWVQRGFIARVSGPLSSLIGGQCGRCGGDRRVCDIYRPSLGDWIEMPTSRVPIDVSQYRAVRNCPACSGTGRTTGVLRDVVKREPVATVEVTDRDPHPNRNDPETYCGWIRHGEFGDENRPDVLPADLYDALEGGSEQYDSVQWMKYPTPDAARAALSAALLHLAVAPVEVRHEAPAGVSDIFGRAVHRTHSRD